MLSEKSADKIEDILDEYSAKSRNFLDIYPIKHTPQTNTSHSQICVMFDLAPNDCVGFSITKNNNKTLSHTFSGQSITLNEPKFYQPPRNNDATDNNGYLPIEYIQFLMSALQKTMPREITSCSFGDGVMRRKLFSPKEELKNSDSIDINRKDPKDSNKPNICCR